MITFLKWVLIIELIAIILATLDRFSELKDIFDEFSNDRPR
jgi:hypothetical protein